MPLLSALSNGVFVLYMAFYFMFAFQFGLRFANTHLMSESNKEKFQIQKHFDKYLLGGLVINSFVCGIISNGGEGKFIALMLFVIAIGGFSYLFNRFATKTKLHLEDSSQATN